MFEAMSELSKDLDQYLGVDEIVDGVMHIDVVAGRCRLNQTVLVNGESHQVNVEFGMTRTDDQKSRCEFDVTEVMPLPFQRPPP